MRSLILSLAAVSLSTLALAQNETVEELASEEEVQAVSDAIGKIGCTAEQIEKENENLFEIDDAECEIGQYDIKLDGEYNIISMTRD